MAQQEVAQRTRKESAVFTRSGIRKQRGTVERATAFGVLVLSFLGSAAACSGGWALIVQGQGSGVGFAFGLLLQGLLTWMQWAYAGVRALAWPSRAVDAALTAAGYGPLVFGALASWIVANGASNTPANVLGWEVIPATLGTWCILWIVSLLPAWYPESRLID